MSWGPRTDEENKSKLGTETHSSLPLNYRHNVSSLHLSVSQPWCTVSSGTPSLKQRVLFLSCSYQLFYRAMRKVIRFRKGFTKMFSWEYFPSWESPSNNVSTMHCHFLFHLTLYFLNLWIYRSFTFPPCCFVICTLLSFREES